MPLKEREVDLRRSDGGPPADLATLRVQLVAKEREIEEMVFDRVQEISDPACTEDPDYREGLRAAVASSFRFGLEALEREDRAVRFPEPLLDQTRLAARTGIALDTVLRRCFCGFAIFSDFLIQAAEQGDSLSTSELKRVLRAQAEIVDALIATVSDTYTRERESRPMTDHERRVERVRSLLRGEAVDLPDHNYDLSRWHVAMVAGGPGAATAVQTLAKRLDRSHMAVEVDKAIWGWIGGKERLEPRELKRAAEANWPDGVELAIGEPGAGLDGWRLSHRQAKAARGVAERCRRQRPLLYFEVALLAAALGDDLLAKSLHTSFTEPLRNARNGGELLFHTLSAYLAADGNASSAAAALGLNRQTVAMRLRAVEEIIGTPLSSCSAQLQVALQLEGVKNLDDGFLSPQSVS